MDMEKLPVLLVALLAHPTACENEQSSHTQETGLDLLVLAGQLCMGNT